MATLPRTLSGAIVGTLRVTLLLIAVLLPLVRQRWDASFGCPVPAVELGLVPR